MSTGLFNPPLVPKPIEFLDPEQQTRAAALMIAQQCRRERDSLDEMISAAAYIVSGREFGLSLNLGALSEDPRLTGE